MKVYAGFPIANTVRTEIAKPAFNAEKPDVKLGSAFFLTPDVIAEHLVSSAAGADIFQILADHWDEP